MLESFGRLIFAILKYISIIIRAQTSAPKGAMLVPESNAVTEFSYVLDGTYENVFLYVLRWTYRN